MALVRYTAPTERPSTITKLISRLRGRNPTDTPKQTTQEATQHQQTPPHDQIKPLIPSPLPLVLPEHQQALSNLGWTTITFPPPAPTDPTSTHPPLPHPLQTASDSLFTAAETFFAQPASQKAPWKHRLGSEEGWSCIPGEKEFITLRTLAYCPEILQGPAKQYWDLMGGHLAKTLGRVGASLGLADLEEDDDAGLKKFVGPCASMPTAEAGKTATMLRLFRYEGWEAKEVAEPHGDLGLLSVVVGSVAGLEVWDGEGWFEVERDVEARGARGASLLAGKQLERLSNGRYPAGGHRVVSYGDVGRADGGKTYRYSIVFVLRAHEPVLIDSKDFETHITGKWAEPVQGLTAGELYAQIRGAHFNINISQEERERQRENVRRMREGSG